VVALPSRRRGQGWSGQLFIKIKEDPVGVPKHVRRVAEGEQEGFVLTRYVRPGK